MADIKLLDCTLRDGGYVNDWQWGFGSARRIIQTLTRAGVDVVEVGFLRNVDGYDPDVTVCNTIEELNRLLPDEGQRGHTMYSGMRCAPTTTSKSCPLRWTWHRNHPHHRARLRH